MQEGYAVVFAGDSDSVAWCSRGSGNVYGGGDGAACIRHGGCVRSWGRDGYFDIPHAVGGVPVSGEIDVDLVHD